MCILYQGQPCPLFTRVIIIIIIIIKTLFQEGNTISTKLISLAALKSYGPLSVLAILSTEVLVSATPPTVFKGF